MEPTLPCIVQALRAAAPAALLHPQNPSTASPSGAAASSRTPSQPSISSRCTRSRAAPDWSVADSLVLIEQIAVVDAELWSKTLSSFQKWKIVADNCAQIGFLRSSNLCKRRWELLVSDYKKIRRWETLKSRNSGLGPRSESYWKLDPDWRERFGLPGLFSPELYSAMDAVVKIEGSRDIDSELLVIGPIEPIDGEEASVPLIGNGGAPNDAGNMHADDLDHKDKGKEELDESLLSTEAWDLATKLEENAEHIQSILKGENGGDLFSSDNIDLAVATEKTEELMKSLEGLVQSLDEFTELVKSNGLENVVALGSYLSM